MIYKKKNQIKSNEMMHKKLRRRYQLEKDILQQIFNFIFWI